MGHGLKTFLAVNSRNTVLDSRNEDNIIYKDRLIMPILKNVWMSEGDNKVENKLNM